MTEHKAFFDTALFIYAMEKKDRRVRALFEQYLSTHTLCTSVITVMEYVTGCMKANNAASQKAFMAFLKDHSFEIEYIDINTAIKAARIRADHPAFKGMDSLQLAAALESGAEVFCTNDHQLMQFQDDRMQIRIP